MDNEQWRERWQSGQTGFHEPKPHPLLVEYLPVLNIAQGDAVFVPLCGASIDMQYLVHSGYRVVGCELSELACQQYFIENNLTYRVKQAEPFICYEGANIQLFCGDVFQLTEKITGKMQAVYDRAALIALDPEQRIPYVKKLNDLLPKMNLLLITITHDSAEGPPHSIEDKVVQSLFPNNKTIPLLTTANTPTVKRLQDRGKLNVKEHVFLSSLMLSHSWR